MNANCRDALIKDFLELVCSQDCATVDDGLIVEKLVELVKESVDFVLLGQLHEEMFEI